MVENLIRQFLRWWVTELRALVPARFRTESRPRGEALEFAVGSDVVVVSHLRDGHAQPLGRMSAGAASGDAVDTPDVTRPDQLAILIDRLKPETTRCEVRVPASLALIKEVTLPLAASENLRQVLAFEMERQTPFRADEVYFDFIVLERDAREQQMTLQVGVVPRRIVDDALTPVRDWDLVQQMEPHANGEVGESGVGLTFLSSRYRTRFTARLTPVLVTVNVLLLVAAILVPLSQQRSVVDELAGELTRAKLQANDTLAVQERIAQLRTEAEFLTQRSFGHLPVVELLEELSALLPDSTWLFRLEVKEGSVHLQGTSVAASSLIATLEQSEHLANVRFVSPVLREANSGRERFHLSADIAEGLPGDAGTTARRAKGRSG